MSSLEENLEKPLIPFWKCQAWKAILWPQSNSCAVHLLLTGCLSLSSLCLVLTPFLQACPFPPSPRAALGAFILITISCVSPFSIAFLHVYFTVSLLQ